MTVLPGTVETGTPGAVLASAREAAGLSVADVAAQMRLSPRQVEALEADRYNELPGAVFVRGFIRNYARVLKLDPVPLLHALEPSLDEDAPLRVRATSGTLPLSARRDHAKPLLIVFGLIVVAVLAAGGYELWSRQQTTVVPDVADSAASRSVQSTVVPSKKLQQPTTTVLPSTNAPVEPAHEPPAGAETAAPAPGAIDPAPPSPTNATSTARAARLLVQFTADSWLEIRDREGAVIYSGTGQAGSERAVEAIPPLSVVIGNANGVRITYNDRAVDLTPHAARNIARLTLE